MYLQCQVPRKQFCFQYYEYYGYYTLKLIFHGFRKPWNFSLIQYLIEKSVNLADTLTIIHYPNRNLQRRPCKACSSRESLSSMWTKKLIFILWKTVFNIFVATSSSKLVNIAHKRHKVKYSWSNLWVAQYNIYCKVLSIKMQL